MRTLLETVGRSTASFAYRSATFFASPVRSDLFQPSKSAAISFLEGFFGVASAPAVPTPAVMVAAVTTAAAVTMAARMRFLRVIAISRARLGCYCLRFLCGGSDSRFA